MQKLLVLLVVFGLLTFAACGGGGGPLTPPSKAPALAGEVAKHGVSSIHGISADGDLEVKVVVTNPNPPDTDVDTVRFCLKHDPQENSPLTDTEAKGYLDPVPAELPANIDVQTVDYTGSPQTITISLFKGNPLTPNDRYWISAVFVSSAGTAGPATTPQRFKLIFKYQLVQPPAIGIVKTFEGTVYNHQDMRLRNAFVQYFHEGKFLEACVTEDDGTYQMEVTVPNPTGTSALKDVCCEESEDPTEYILKVYHPDYDYEPFKYLLPEYVHYYVDLKFTTPHDQGGGSSL
jgi:hypothetical protein